jgi:predicted nucleotidyltransferase
VFGRVVDLAVKPPRKPLFLARGTDRGPADPCGVTAVAQALPLYTESRARISRGNMYHEEITQLTARIVAAERPEKIILFGSYASGTATESRDIDLLVISRSTLSRREREVRLTRQLFGSGVQYDLFVLTPEEVEERLCRNGPFIREILSTGQVVYQRP